MTLGSVRSNIFPCVGVMVPSLVWGVNTQLGQILPYVECGASIKWTALTSFAAALLSLAAGLLSWQVTKDDKSDSLPLTAYPRSFSFVGLVSGLSGALFAFALVLQGSASLVLTGCER